MTEAVVPLQHLSIISILIHLHRVLSLSLHQTHQISFYRNSILWLILPLIALSRSQASCICSIRCLFLNPFGSLSAIRCHTKDSISLRFHSDSAALGRAVSTIIGTGFTTLINIVIEADPTVLKMLASSYHDQLITVRKTIKW